MELLWYCILLLVASVYFILDGYDFGVGIIHLFLARGREEKETVAKAAGLFWDFNEVWLVVLGGLLFMAFPVYYASVFSGFYLPLTILLWLLIFRAIGIELKAHFQNEVWRTFWEKSFGISSLLLALFCGAALGNLVRGVDIGGQDTPGSFGHQYFFLPLWNDTFSPLRVDAGVLDWFTLLIGLQAVLILTIHGANWIILKTNSTINGRLLRLIPSLAIAELVLIVLSVAAWNYVEPAGFKGFMERPFLLIFPLIFFAGFLLQLFRQRIKHPVLAFSGSSALIFSGIVSSMAPMFPVILPSRSSISNGLTVYNTATSEYAFSTATVWMVLGFLLTAVYFIIQQRILKGKIDHLEQEH